MNSINGLGRRQVHTCPHCKKRCRGKRGLAMHIDAMHRTDLGETPVERSENSTSEKEQSFADRARAAEIAIACGEPTDDDWLLP